MPATVTKDQNRFTESAPPARPVGQKNSHNLKKVVIKFVAINSWNRYGLIMFASGAAPHYFTHRPYSLNRQILLLVVCILGMLALAGLTRLGIASAVSGWYATLTLPEMTPPPAVFGIVWAAIYALMGVSLWCVLRDGRWRAMPGTLALFALQLGVNAIWTIVFFTLQETGMALLIAVALFGLVTLTAWRFAALDLKSGLLFVPYIGWTAMGIWLNYGVWVLN